MTPPLAVSSQFVHNAGGGVVRFKCEAYRSHCGALEKARSAAAQASLANAPLAVIVIDLGRPRP